MDSEPIDILEALVRVIAERVDQDPKKSYVAELLQGPETVVLDKLREELEELCVASQNEGKSGTVHEAADVLFHLLVLLQARNVSLDAVLTELRGRFGISGHVEKSLRSQQDSS